MIKTFEVYNREDLDQEDPWSGILTAIIFGLRSTFHSTLKATPMQLVYGRDTILPIFHQADWKYIKDTKEDREIEKKERKDIQDFVQRADV